ncbi:uncharacterized protein LOC133866329 [Alnus glutinosa]|uniref:uncharacterized protein LOC133866329 n=1 Tax=Alnus glutinosa TaxID=3517 RepID=UPI002D7890C0|nr:uncharacterized protein LOC133866329 [Alnus glutinosa]
MDELDYVVANRWIGYAIESNVKELNLGLKSCAYSSQKKPEEYQVPESILRAKSIILLKLSASNLKSKSSYNDINLSSLRKLILSRVDMDDQIFSSLIYGCPVLEEIEIAQCYGLKNIHLPACLPKLTAIALLYDCNGLESFEVEAPNLKTLVLNSPIVTDKWLHSILSKHPLIESLALKSCDMLERIKISSDRMKSLIICQCSYLVEVNIVTPNLYRLGYSGDVIPFSPNDFTLLEVSLHFSRKTSLDVETIEFLAKLGHPKLSMSCSGCGKSLIAPKELRETLPSPLYNVKHLKLKVWYHVYDRMRDEIIELVDSLLWISPLLEILLIEWETGDNISFKFSYETPVYKSKNPGCCKFLPILCWRHCLKTIKIDESGRSADVKALKKYFHKNAEILESIL